MTHPKDETLAAFADRILGPDQAEAVRRHLDTCGSCRGQVELATTAKQALEGLGEVEVPVGVTGPVLAEAGLEPSAPAAKHPAGARGAARVPRVYRVMATAAAGLLILAGGWAAVSTLTEGGDESTSTAAAGMAEPAPEIPAADTEKLESLASEKALALDEDAPADSGNAVEQEAGAEYSGDTTAGPSTTPGASREVAGAAWSTTLDDRTRRCVDMAGALDQGGTVLEVLKDTYAGQDAWYVVISEGPEPGARHDRVTVWVLARKGCRILALTTKYYPSMRPSPPTAFPSP